MRICFISEFFHSPKERFLAGGIRRLVETARAIAKDHEVHVYCFLAPGELKEEILDGVHVHRVGLGPFAPKTFVDARRLLNAPLLIGALNRKFDVINTNFLFPPIPSNIVAKLRGTPILLTVDDLLWTELKQTCGVSSSSFIAKSGSLLERLGLRLNYDGIITVSQFTKDDVVRLGVPKGKVFVVHNGVRLNLIDSVQDGFISEKSAVFVGRFEQYKGVLDIIDATRLLVDKTPDLKVRFVGNGQARDVMERKVHELELSKNVEILGFLSNKEVIQVIKSSDCLVLPSVREGFGLVLVEAMACRKPVIAYNIPAVREIIQME